jgi:hypothetical protein
MTREAGTERRRAWKLMLACARHAAGASDAASVARASAKVHDWALALSIAADQGLLLLLARALTEGDAPSHVRRQIEAGVHAPSTEAMSRLRLLSRLCAALAREGVPALPVEGPLLSLQLYGDVALRGSDSLDLLVGRGGYLRARDVLIAQGMAADVGPSVRKGRATFERLGLATFSGPLGATVTLRWRLAPAGFPPSLGLEDALRRSRALSAGGHVFPVMASRDLVVTLAASGARQLYSRLVWLAGVARLLHDDGTDPGALLAHAERLHGRRMLLVSVAVAEIVLGIPLRDAWNAAIAADPVAALLAQEMAAAMELRAVDEHPVPGGAELHAVHARLLDGRIDRLRYAARHELLGFLNPATARHPQPASIALS